MSEPGRDLDRRTPGHHTPGHQTPGHQTPGHHTPGRHTPGHHTPGHHTPGHYTPGYQTPGHQTPGHHTPGHHTPGHHTPGHHTPGQHTPGHHTPGHHTPGQHTPGHLLTQSEHDIIRSFLSTVPAGFPLSPGAALAELTGLAPLSPGLGAAPYHLAMSPRHQDPPSPSRYLHTTDRGYSRPGLAIHSPRVVSPPRPSVESPHRTHSACNSPRRFLSSPLRVAPRTYSPEAPHRNSSPLHLHSLHRDNFGSPGRSEAWSPPPYEAEVPHPQHFLPQAAEPTGSRFRGQALSPAYRRHNTDCSPTRPSLSYSPHSLSLPRHSPSHPPLTESPRPAPSRRCPDRGDYYSFSPPPCHLQPSLPRVPVPLQQLNQGEPLDLEVTHYTEDLTKHSLLQNRESLSLPLKDKPLTKLITKRIATEKQRSKGKRREDRRLKGQKRRREGGDVTEEQIQQSSSLETGVAEVASRLAAGCQCGQHCLYNLDPGFVHRHRTQVAKLNRSQHDMYLMGLVMATLVNPRTTSKKNERQRNRNKYMFQGQEVCVEAFLYLENVTSYHLKAIRSHVIDVGVEARASAKEAKKRRVEDIGGQKHSEAALAFVSGLLRNSGSKALSYRRLYELYRDKFRGEKEVMEYPVFRAWAHNRLPGLQGGEHQTREGISLPVKEDNTDTVIKLEMNAF